jgi:hypothetical protein
MTAEFALQIPRNTIKSEIRDPKAKIEESIVVTRIGCSSRGEPWGYGEYIKPVH